MRGILTFLVILWSCPGFGNDQPTAEDELSKALRNLVTSLEKVETGLRHSPSFRTPEEQAQGYRHLIRSLMKGLESGVLQDPDYPYFRILDHWLKEGGDNPDQRYGFSPVHGGKDYRIWGTLGSAVRMEVQLYAGRAWDGTGKSVGYLHFQDLAINDDGSFEIWLTADKRTSNWLQNHEEATTVFVRHIYDDWNAADTGTVHIDRIGFEGKRRPLESPAELADGINRAAEMFSATALTWPGVVNNRFVKLRPVNTVSTPYDTYSRGGAKGRWMSGGYFELAEDEALLIRMEATEATYQAIQLTDMWFASFEYGNQVSSLTTKQSQISPDGSYYYVITGEDPGYANWLDTGGAARGTLLIRWDGMNDELPMSAFPTSQVIKLESLEKAIPGYTETTATERFETRAARREHLQRRSNR